MFGRLQMVAFFLLGLCCCDVDGKKDCDWVLEPEPDLISKVESGFVPLCARNRKTMKQDCRLQAPLAAAKEYSGKRFRYSDLEVSSVGLPRTIKSVRFCR